jgi:hypothetical protein
MRLVQVRADSWEEEEEAREEGEVRLDSVVPVEPRGGFDEVGLRKTSCGAQEAYMSTMTQIKDRHEEEGGVRRGRGRTGRRCRSSSVSNRSATSSHRTALERLVLFIRQLRDADASEAHERRRRKDPGGSQAALDRGLLRRLPRGPPS